MNTTELNQVKAARSILDSLLASNAPDTIEPMPTSNEKIAVCVGHSRDRDKGAVSVGGVSEWDFNSHVAMLTANELGKRGHDAIVVSHYEGRGYSAAMDWLGEHLKGHGVTLAIELHFNSASSSAAGFEYLYWHKSTNGKRLAESLNAAQDLHGHSSPNRGAKPLSGDRGSGFVSETSCVSCICEPFFGSNPGDWSYWSHKARELALINADGITNYLTK